MALDSRILQGLFVAHIPGSIFIAQVARVRVFPIRQLFYRLYMRVTRSAMRYFTMSVRELYKSSYIYRRLSVATLK